MSIITAKLNKNEVVGVYTQTAPLYELWGSLTETKARNRSSLVPASIYFWTVMLPRLQAKPVGGKFHPFAPVYGASRTSATISTS